MHQSHLMYRTKQPQRLRRFSNLLPFLVWVKQGTKVIAGEASAYHCQASYCTILPGNIQVDIENLPVRSGNYLAHALTPKVQ